MCRLVVAACALAIALSLTACGYSGGPIRGQVFEPSDEPSDPSKRVPAMGAYVFVQSKGYAPQPFHGRTVCLHLTVTRVGGDGQFSLPSWSARPKPYPVVDRERYVRVVKRGFIQTGDSRIRGDFVDVMLAKDSSPPETRLSSIWDDAMVLCDLNPRTMYDGLDPRIRDVNGTLVWYYHDLYNEARELPLQTRNDNDTRTLLLHELKRHIARLTFSSVEAVYVLPSIQSLRPDQVPKPALGIRIEGPGIPVQQRY